MILARDVDFELRVGDVRDELRELEAGSVDCVVTSPPYWSLRDYGTGGWEGGDPGCPHSQGRGTNVAETKRNGAAPFPAGAPHRGGNAWECERCGATRVDRQLGLEPTLHEYVEAIVGVFREVRRVLADHGTVWLNLGDVYASDTKWGGATGGKHVDALHGADGTRERRATGLGPKNLTGLPWRVAFALQDDGWTLRSGCVWDKPNGMPESVRDRPNVSHEYVFMLTKRPKYWYDRVAVLEPFAEASLARYDYGFNKLGKGVGPDGASHTKGEGSPVRFAPKVGADPAQPTLDASLPPEAPRGADGRRATRVEGRDLSAQHRNGERWPDEGRNMRTVWRIPTQPLRDAHFAVFPEALVEKCLLASCPPQVCVHCGSPRTRIVAREGGPQGDHVAAAGVVRHPEVASNADEAVRATGGARASGSVLSARYREHGYASFSTSGWTECGCRSGLKPDDLELVETPLGEAGDDPTLEVGRRGFARERGDGEGTRPMTRYEQRAYARQLRGMRAYPESFAEATAGVPAEALAHYMREDAAGARPIPPDLLEGWLEMGFLKPVDPPEVPPGEYRPGVVMDPFLGSGTTALVARRHGRRCVGIELNPAYAEIALARTQQLSLLAS